MGISIPVTIYFWIFVPSTKEKPAPIIRQEHITPKESTIAQCDVSKTASPEITLDGITANWDGLESKIVQWVKEGRSLTPELAVYICGEIDKNLCEPIQIVEGQSRRREMQPGLVLLKVSNFGDNPPVKVKFTVKCPG